MISLRAHLKKIAPLGGKARALSLSKKEKSAHAKRMVAAREAKKHTTGVSLKPSPSKQEKRSK